LSLLALAACGEDALFGDPGASSGKGGGGQSAGGDGGKAGAGGTMAGNGGSGATGGSGASGGSGAQGGGGGSAGAGGVPWTQPTCSPACDVFAPFCCDKGAGPTCQVSADGCWCDPTLPTASCGGFFDDCCVAPGDTLGTCKSSLTGCACNTAGSDDCGTFSVCCDKDNGNGNVCYDTADNCLCGADDSVCDIFFDVCCDKGSGEKCYADEGNCM
jgi:hypothetical protein